MTGSTESLSDNASGVTSCSHFESQLGSACTILAVKCLHFWRHLLHQSSGFGYLTRVDRPFRWARDSEEYSANTLAADFMAKGRAVNSMFLYIMRRDTLKPSHTNIIYMYILVCKKKKQAPVNKLFFSPWVQIYFYCWGTPRAHHSDLGRCSFHFTTVNVDLLKPLTGVNTYNFPSPEEDQKMFVNTHI